ncbi:MAG: site-specific DNA-methyltransferase [Thermoflexibacter sp.]|jgi:adenine-specific DNA-methyltransferase|nr:site-specific DNA-methyltransferase [Thermoflexibacter sp.]
MSLQKIVEIIGEPFFSNEFVAIYNLDCKEGLQRMIDHKLKVNSTITSPPYNIGKEYERPLTVNQYVDWLSQISDLLYQITKNNGSYLLNLGYLKIENQARALPIPYLIWDRIKFYLQQEIVWNYGAGVACKNYLSPRNEKILWYVKNIEEYTFNLDAIRDPDVKYPNSKKNGKLRANTLGKNPSDVWQIAKVTTGANRSSEERTDHPAQFPEDLVQRMVLGFTNELDIILDPFLGSGTTATVAMKNKRYCIGFEINKDYCKIATDRIKELELSIAVKSAILF